MAEFVPIGTILAVVSNQIIRTAQAAKDVVFEKESFKILAKHLFDIDPVLKELQLKQLNDSPATRQAFDCLEIDVRKANNLVEKYKNRSRFYLLVKCRHIVKEIQDVTREIGKSLTALSLANIEVLSGISDQVNRLQNEMQQAEFEASKSQLQIVDKLNQGLSGQVFDKEFANDILKEIARAVGVPVEPAEITRELANFKREKEEAQNRKEMAEVLFLEQVIELLSRADAAKDYEQVRDQYFQRVKVIDRYDSKEEYIRPLKPFFCCITGDLMVDPVSLCTGTTCERTALESWFECGNITDPETGELLQDFSYRSNIQLRQSIQEWRELNYCVKIRSCKEKLLSGVNSSVEETMDQVKELVEENDINKDWISISGLTGVAVAMLGSMLSGEVKKALLMTLKDIVQGHAINKVIFIENQGIGKLIPCLSLDSRISKAAVELLYEVLRDRSGWNTSYCMMLSKDRDMIPVLVSLLKSLVDEVTKTAEEILLKLCDTDENVIQAAKVNWFRPLVDKVVHGSASGRISMVKELASWELDEEKLNLLGEEGMTRPLLEMASGSVESRDLSLQLLVKLSTLPQNKRLIASSGGVSLILNLLFSSHTHIFIISKCAEILANLSSNGDGTKFLTSETGTQLKLEAVTTRLLAFQENLYSLDIIRRPALQALLGICQSEAGLVKFAVLSSNGVSLVLSLLDDLNQEIRELAINLLFLFSQHEPQGVVEYLLKPRRLEALVGFLENFENSDVQMAAAGLLANLPKSETSLTEKLVELGGLKAIVSILNSGTIQAKENALSALFRFTDPTNLKSQRMVVELGAYPQLAGLLKSDSVTARARAAALLGDLSMRSPELTDKSNKHRFWCIPRTSVSICPAHGGICSVEKTFCLLKTDALSDLVRLVQDKVHATAYEAIQTLSTLVQEEYPQRGTNVLHENGAIGPAIEVLSWGSESLKGEALALLEKIFVSREMVDLYGSKAKSPLICLTGRRIYDDGCLQRKAARILLLIERYSKASAAVAAGLNN